MENTVVKPFWIWMFSSLILFFLYLIKDIIVFLSTSGLKILTFLKSRFNQGKGVIKSPNIMNMDPSRRRFLKAASAGIALPPIALTSYSIFNNSDGIFDNKFELNFPQLPENLRGLKIAHFTDIHCDQYTSKEKISKAVGIINDAEPDIVLLTGDYVSHEAGFIYPCMDALKDLRSRHGVFASMGNHDHWADLPLIIKEFEKNGIPVLHNAGRTLSINDTKLDLLGVDDSRWGYADIRTALSYVEGGIVEGNNGDASNFKILMSHQPPYWDVAQKEGVDLVLSGHTHGGQIALNVLGSEVSFVGLFSKYIKGTFEKGDSTLYVNSGFGFTGPPIRLNNPPEVAIITLA
ncbi:metallophosphoesterase [candidate division KSB1 bacterium]